MPDNMPVNGQRDDEELTRTPEQELRIILEARITELENALNVWTSVEDRLPEDGFSHCLFYSKSEDICAVGGMHKGVLQVNDEDVFHNNVTHWMPLPEPPAIAKGEKE